MTEGPTSLSPARFTARLLTFRLSPLAFAGMSRSSLLLGLLGTWLVGMGRHWDDPNAHLLQHLGIGSLLYVFFLAFVIWGVFMPLKPKRWRYLNVLTFLSLTSFPAAIYAIPVEKFLSVDAATDANLAFLLIVAGWRVALLLLFLRRYARLTWPRAIIGTAFPLFSALTVLAVYRLLGSIVIIMGGIRERPAFTFGDLACPFAILTLAAFIAYVVLAARVQQPEE